MAKVVWYLLNHEKYKSIMASMASIIKSINMAIPIGKYNFIMELTNMTLT